MANITNGKLVPGSLTADDLEQELDACSSFSGGMIGILQHLQQICSEKEEHVSSVWQDRALAKEWAKARKILEKCEAAMNGVNL